MTTSAAENLAGHGVEKKEEKVEKRRALGRGLASLLPGPRVVAPAAESRVPSADPAEAVPFPTSAGAGSGGPASGKQVPHFVRNDKDAGTTASGELEASRTGVSDPHELSSHRAAYAAGQPAAAIPKLADSTLADPAMTDPVSDEDGAGEVISIQAVAAGGCRGIWWRRLRWS